jgi:hypothetical protein
VFSHPGGWGGFLTDLVILPDQRLAAAVSCNQGDVASPTEIALQMLDTLRSG